MAEVRCYQPLPHDLFDRRTAALAACEACGFVWILDEDGCGSIDSGERWCPRCQAFGAGPLYTPATKPVALPAPPSGEGER